MSLWPDVEFDGVLQQTRAYFWVTKVISIGGVSRFFVVLQRSRTFIIVWLHCAICCLHLIYLASPGPVGLKLVLKSLLICKFYRWVFVVLCWVEMLNICCLWVLVVVIFGDLEFSITAVRIDLTEPLQLWSLESLSTDFLTRWIFVVAILGI